MEPLIVNLSPDNPVHEMASICMECYREGMTRLMLTKIPYFKEIIVSSFRCEFCGNSNNNVQPASSMGDRGVRYTLTLTNTNDLNRQVIKSEWGCIRIPELDFEIPPESQRGSSNTVEGFLLRTKEGLQSQQKDRREQHPQLAEQLDSFIGKLEDLIGFTQPFTFILDDPSGNSFVENPRAPKEDPQLKVERYVRSKEDMDLLGISSIREALDNEVTDNQNVLPEENEDAGEETSVRYNENTEIMTFEALCNACGRDAVCNMKQVDIPFFKKILLMANVCDHCGYKDSEVKSAGGISEHGQRITLTMTDAGMDLVRDILKSETAKIHIPELDLTMTSGCLGGRFTTVEGMLENVRDQLSSINPFSFGDSAPTDGTETAEDEGKDGMKNVISQLEAVIRGERLVKIVLDDPAGNSFIQNLYAPDSDPNLLMEEYVRTDEENDELGIKFMKTENYEDS